MEKASGMNLPQCLLGSVVGELLELFSYGSGIRLIFRMGLPLS